MKVRELIPILNVSNIQESFEWFAPSLLASAASPVAATFVIQAVTRFVSARELRRNAYST
jgi:hypothetical protein